MPYDRHDLCKKLQVIPKTEIRCVVHYEPCLMTGMTYVRVSDYTSCME